MHIYTHAHTLTRGQKDSHTHTRACAHAHTHTHTHTHTHAHKRAARINEGTEPDASAAVYLASTGDSVLFLFSLLLLPHGQYIGDRFRNLAEEEDQVSLLTLNKLASP